MATIQMAALARFIWILADVRHRTSNVRYRIIPILTYDIVCLDVRHRSRTTSYVPYVRYRMTMSYVGYVRCRDLRCRMSDVRYRTIHQNRTSDIRHRTLFIACDVVGPGLHIACFWLHIVCDVAYDIVCDVLFCSIRVGDLFK